MYNHLYFICPTDHLEPVINNSFKQENYYITSPCNSIEFDTKMISKVSDLLQNEKIRDISFILSDDNRFISDGLDKMAFSKIQDFQSFYKRITHQKEYCDKFWQTSNYRFLILSYYINSKIIELKLGLNQLSHSHVSINGLVYKRQEELFCKIYSDLICKKCFSLN